MKRNIEVLSPAGNYDSFVAACQNGADAIYMGLGKYNAREMAKNFDLDEYIKAIEYAHLRGIKVYLTLNTLMYDDEINEALKLVLKLYNNGLDAVIVQDIGLFYLIHKMVPDLHIHASTQMSVYSLEQVKLLEKLGFKRVVLARELSIKEIEYICKNTNVEIEVFVHGALCVSFSGQCLLSETIGNRSANRGRCAQPCRMKYTLYNVKGKKLQESTYILSKKDIFGLEYIEKLINAGVTSLKIEGRNKNPEYVALVTSMYRKYVTKSIDKKSSNIPISFDSNDIYALLQMFNRNGKSAGYLDGVKYKDSITLMSPKNTGVYLGEVLSQKKNFIKLKLEESIDIHDGFEIYSEDKVVSNIVTCIKDENYKIVNTKKEKGEYVFIGDVNQKVKYGSKVYKTSSESLNKTYRVTYKNNIQNRKTKIDIKFKFSKTENICSCITIDNKNIVYEMEYIPEVAIKKALTKEDIESVFKKTVDIPFTFNICDIVLDDNIFIPISKLNEFRRNIVKKIEDTILQNIKKDEVTCNIPTFMENIKQKFIADNKINISKNISKENLLYVYSYNKDIDYTLLYFNKYKEKLNRIYITIQDYIKYGKEILDKYKDKVDIYINVQNVVFDNVDKFIKANIVNILENGIKGFLLGSLRYIELLNDYKKRYNIKIVADYSLNVSNTYSMLFLQSLGFDVITPAYEVPIESVENMSKYIEVESACDIITVMTSRYCILGSFVSNTKEYKKCNMPCIKDRYYLEDTYSNKYDIVCDNIDCITRITKSKKCILQDKSKYSFNIRHSIL